MRLRFTNAQNSKMDFIGRALQALFMLLLLTCSGSFAQLEKGINRLGFEFDVDATAELNRKSIRFDIGDMITDHIELDVGIGSLLDDGMPISGVIIQCGTIYHFLPKGKTIPGVGASLALPLYWLEKNTSVILNMAFNLDFFVSRKWSLNIKAGYEREYRGARTGNVNRDWVSMQIGMYRLLGRKD